MTEPTSISSEATAPQQVRPLPPRYWRSLDEWIDDPAIAERVAAEFSPDASVWLNPVSRRDFIRVMGASLALAGITGCSDLPDEKIVPYVNQPESVVPGNPSFYATTVSMNGYGIGVLAESHEGRPTKIEGNPDHPASLGGSNVFMQASVLDLYDPSRSRLVTLAGVPTSWADFSRSLRQHLEQRHLEQRADSQVPAAGAPGNHTIAGRGIRLLTRSITSPTFARQLAALRERFPGMRWHTYEPTGYAGCSARLGGAPGQAVFDFSKATVICALDADVLFSDPGSVRYARQFADARRRQPGLEAARQTMNRLYVAESFFSITGSMADHRLAVAPEVVLQLARSIAARLGAVAEPPPALPAVQQRFVNAVADDLRQAGGNGVVVAGDGHPPELQQLACAMNTRLGCIGSAVRYIAPVEVPGSLDLSSLVTDMRAGEVDTLLILSGNPAYDAPADIPFAAELQRLSNLRNTANQPACLTAHLGPNEDETSFLCQWHLPELHYLESWGDIRAFDGTASIIQPLILPLSSSAKSIWDVMALLLDQPDQSAYEAVRACWQEQWRPVPSTNRPVTQPATQPAASPSANTPPPRAQADARDFQEWWQLVLRKGTIDGTAGESLESISPVAAASNAAIAPPAAGAWSLVFRPDPSMWDGQYAANAWLAELPKPFTKLVWENAALISPASASSLGLSDGSRVRVTHGGRSLDVPILILPGTPDQSLTLPLGYGHTRGGAVTMDGGSGVRGFNAALLRTAINPGFASGARVAALPGAAQPLVTTRSHHAMYALPGFGPPADSGLLKPDAIEHPETSESEIELHNRRLVRSGTLAQFRTDANWVTRLGGEGEMRDKGLGEEGGGRRVSLSLYPTGAAEGGWDYSKGHRWAMSIDQTACIGCNACVVACQAENNIPVVGKEQVAVQREMHWIRLDDWFGARPGADASEGLTDPQVIHMPVACQHCENAPCEVVCPVGATTHSREGINEMTYNRCIGTRYCSNNCPYKVRRFNFLLYADSSPTRALQYNPEVTVRTRGVMEKCTFCVQRLNRTRMDIEKMIVAIEERADRLAATATEQARSLRDSIPTHRRNLLDALQAACQQACPTRAIVFGDSNEPGTAVARVKDDALEYTLLADLTTRPRTSYLARLSNPNPTF